MTYIAWPTNLRAKKIILHNLNARARDYTSSSITRFQQDFDSSSTASHRQCTFVHNFVVRPFVLYSNLCRLALTGRSSDYQRDTSNESRLVNHIGVCPCSPGRLHPCIFFEPRSAQARLAKDHQITSFLPHSIRGNEFLHRGQRRNQL